MDNEARELVRQLREHRLRSDSDVLDSLARAIDRLQKTFPNRGHFLLEFIQNADDAGSAHLLIRIEPWGLHIRNDGKAFECPDVRSICRIGRSTKGNTGDYVGYLGVGFKSVFLVSDSPQVLSGQFRFEFNRSRWTEPDRIPWQVLPFWVDDPLLPVDAEFVEGAEFAIPLDRRGATHLFEKVSNEVRPEHFSRRALLFLRNLTKITFDDAVSGIRRSLTRKRLEEPADGWDLYEIEETMDGTMQTERWCVFKAKCQVPDDVRHDLATVDWERDEVQHREVAVAVQVDDNGQLARCQGAAHTAVFSYLPLKEVPSGLPFLIQSDFLTSPGRNSLLRDAKWNQWLIKEAYNLITHSVIPALKKHPTWRYSVSSVLRPGDGGPEVIVDNLTRPLQRYLSENAVLAVQEGGFIKPDEAVTVDTSLLEWVSIADIEALFPGMKVISVLTEVPYQNSNLLTTGPRINHDKLNEPMRRLLALKADAKDISFFRAFYDTVGNYSDGTLLYKGLGQENLALTQSWELRRPADVYIADRDVGIVDGRQRLHPLIAEDEDNLQTLELLGVRPLTPEDLNWNDLHHNLLPKWRKEWNQMGDADKINATAQCFLAYKAGKLGAADLDFLTVLTVTPKSSQDSQAGLAPQHNWQPPKSVLLSQAYLPDHHLEHLAKEEKSLFDKVKKWGLSFLSEAYLLHGSPDDWRRFMVNLGVDNPVQQLKEKIVQRIGVRVAIQYEKYRRNVIVDEQGHSEEMGNDIESGDRQIEVKASAYNRFEINLTNRQFQLLRDKPNQYFVYAVTDALTSPVLHVIPGTRLLGLVSSATFRFADWSKEVTDQFEP